MTTQVENEIVLVFTKDVLAYFKTLYEVKLHV